MRIAVNISIMLLSYTAGMAYAGKRGRGGQRKQLETVDQAVALLRAEAIRMFDRGDGREADWALLAQVLFKAAFGAVDAAPVTDRMRTVLRRAEAGFYNRLADNADDGLSSPVEVRRPEPDSAGMRPDRAPRPK